MKTASLLLIVATALCGSQSNAQFSDLCLPQPMREVPITLQIRGAADLPACGDNGLLALPLLASEVEKQILSNYQPPPLFSDCNIVSLEHTSCETLGRRGQRVLIHFKANITCSDGCYRLRGFDQKDSNAIVQYLSQVDSLLNVGRTKSSAEFSYGGRTVEISFFRGKKGGIFSACSGVTAEEGVNKKIPACACPSNCSDPCTLPPETGNCRASIPRYYHNSDSGRCELFTYGGCQGNQNRFTTRVECERACRVCPRGKVYLECGTDCPDTCENKDEEIRICNLRCVQGCFCPPGTFELGDRCVAREECPSTNTTAVDEQCPRGMIYKQCGTACPITCDNKDEVVNCVSVCVSGCFCPDNKVLLEEDGETKCVDRDECPSTPGVEQCPEGKIYKQCGSACPLTCGNKDDVITCTQQCVSGCFCPSGTVELGNKCVAPEECPSTNSTEVEEQCPRGMIYNQCGSACPVTCDNKDEDVKCITVCVPGCFCPRNKVLLEEDGETKCVDRDECPSSTNTTEEVCPQGMVYEECGTACPTTCKNKDVLIRPCTLQCVQGCFCPRDKVLLEEDGETKCVDRDECPSSTNTTEEVCPQGMVYEECGTACPTTCENKDVLIRPCTLQCVQGCFCPRNKVLLEEDGETKCVDRDECPSSTNTTEEVCPQGMVYEECGTACPTTCENKDVLIRPCTLQCVQGCFCPRNKVLLEEDGKTKCVDRDECPSTPGDEQCPEGKIYKQCGSACPLTCENKDDTITCTQQCVPGCFCRDGYVERGNSCVTPKECDAELCSLPPETGPCRARFPRYFYNSTSEQCEQFIYGGCMGNDNRFPTVEECEAKCNDTTEVPPRKRCPRGMIFDECGTACPTTCDNKDVSVRPCSLQCVPGCVCAGPTILLEEEGDTCVARNQCPN